MNLDGKIIYKKKNHSVGILVNGSMNIEIINSQRVLMVDKYR